MPRPLFPLVLALGSALPTAQADDAARADARKIQGVNHLEAIENAKGTVAYDFARPIARVEDANGPEGSNVGYCSGAKVGDGLFLTNLHCDHGCANMLFHLGAERDLPPSEQQIWQCTRLVRSDDNLDYALYTAELVVNAHPQQCNQSPQSQKGPQTQESQENQPDPLDQYSGPDSGGSPASGLEYPAVTLSRSPVHNGQLALLASHPHGDCKEIDRSSGCIVSSAAVTHTTSTSGRDSIEHMCDSDGGSSGAPLLDRQSGQAIGLHWGGLDHAYNFAIPMTLILDDMEQHLPPDIMSRLHVAD